MDHGRTAVPGRGELDPGFGDQIDKPLAWHANELILRPRWVRQRSDEVEECPERKLTSKGSQGPSGMELGCEQERDPNFLQAANQDEGLRFDIDAKLGQDVRASGVS